MKTVPVYLILILGLSIVAFSSCEREDNSLSSANHYTLIVKEAFSETESDISFTIADELVEAFTDVPTINENQPQKVSKMVAFPLVYQVSIDGEYPIVYEIDFGDEYTDKFGRILSGKILLSYGTPGTYRRYETVEFYVNKNQLIGDKTITTKGPKKVGFRILEIVSNDTLLLTNKTTVIRNTNRIRTWIDDNGTPEDWKDDSFSFTGSTTGINTKGEEFSVVIDDEKPLIKVGDFRYYVSGILTTTTKYGKAALDFGDGTLDNLAKLTINDKESSEIVLEW
jgi:hypothetical protein